MLGTQFPFSLRASQTIRSVYPTPAEREEAGCWKHGRRCFPVSILSPLSQARIQFDVRLQRRFTLAQRSGRGKRSPECSNGFLNFLEGKAKGGPDHRHNRVGRHGSIQPGADCTHVRFGFFKIERNVMASRKTEFFLQSLRSLKPKKIRTHG